MLSMSACRQPAADAAAGPRGVSTMRHLPGAAGLHAHKRRHSCTCLAAACTCRVWLDDGRHTTHMLDGVCGVRCRDSKTQCRYDRPHLQERCTHVRTPRDHTPRYTDANAGSAVGLAAGSHKRPPSSQLHMCVSPFIRAPPATPHAVIRLQDLTAGSVNCPHPEPAHQPICAGIQNTHKKNPRQQQHVPNVHTLNTCKAEEF